MRCKMRTYYTMRDILERNYDISKSPFTSLALVGNHTTITNVINAGLELDEVGRYIGMDDITTNVTYQGYITELFNKYIWIRFQNEYLYYHDNDEEYAPWTFTCKIYSWLVSSVEKYGLLIDNLKDNKDSLLDAVKTTSVSRFNDTPQTDSDDIEDLSHNTTVTRGESATDAGTMIERLKEIEDNISELYKKWSNEFRQFVIEA